MTLQNLLLAKTTLDQARYYAREGRITDAVFRSFLHVWQTSAPRFSTQACRCAECLHPARKVEEDF